MIDASIMFIGGAYKSSGVARQQLDQTMGQGAFDAYMNHTSEFMADVGIAKNNGIGRGSSVSADAKSPLGAGQNSGVGAGRFA